MFSLNRHVARAASELDSLGGQERRSLGTTSVRGLGILRRPARAGFHAFVGGLRALAVRSLKDSPPGSTTVVTATWNTLEYLKVCTEMVARHTPGIPHIVIDNHSTDGTREWARARSGFRYISLPRNVGHPLALDLGFLIARTEHVVSLDVDAFPIRDGWLEPLIEPLRAGAKLSGGMINNDAISYPYVHPCCLAVLRADFVLDRQTFWPAQNDSDVGAQMSVRYADRLHMIPVTSAKGPRWVGSVFGDFLYHNWGSTRPGLYDTHDAAWREALERYVLQTQ
jgi:glycosyltransferase involved in cell wall biosynthesis